MGYPMARHLVKSGNEVALWSNRGAKAKSARQGGQRHRLRDAQEVAERSDFIFYCVGDSVHGPRHHLRPRGTDRGRPPRRRDRRLQHHLRRPSAKKSAPSFAAKGAHFLDTPCTGSKPGSENATLTFMIGGDRAAYDKIKPYLDLMGKVFYYCGAAGQGLQAKLTQNLILANIMQAFAEGMVLATKGGVPPDLMLDILNNSAAKSGLISYKAPFILARDFTTNFATKWMAKDIGLALESAKSMDVPLPATALTEQMLRAAIASGYGEDDFCSAIRVLEDWARIEVKT